MPLLEANANARSSLAVPDDRTEQGAGVHSIDDVGNHSGAGVDWLGVERPLAKPLCSSTATTPKPTVMAKKTQSKDASGSASKEKESKQPHQRPMAIVPLDKWLDTTRRLLLRERDEEIETMQQELDTLDDLQNPNVLVNLRVVQSSTGLFGRTLIKFAFPSAHVQRPKPHQFTVGDLVQIRLKKKTGGDKEGGGSKEPKSSARGGAGGAKYPTGIIARVEETIISVALGESEDLDEEQLLANNHAVTLDRLVNNATFVKITSALDQLAKFDYGAAQSVVEIVFSGKSPSWNPLPEITPFNAGLNESQLEAIRFALASKDLALIHGPPGTGKTTTVVEFILQAVKKYKMKVLVCAPSNIAVDNVLEKLATTDRKLQLTRIGHPARLLPQVLKYCLDAKIEAADGTEIVNDIRKEMVTMENQLNKTRDKSVRFNIRRDMKANRKEIRQREQTVVRELVKHSEVVFATNVGASSKLLKDVTFDLVVIDEAAQALEASCWIPILKAKRCVLAGDHLQLPPTIKSKSAASEGLEVTLFDRITRFPSTQSIVKMLKIQYRMHESISDWSSRAMYNNELESFEGVAKRKLHELPHVTIQEDDELLNATLLLLDTAGCGLEEDQDDTAEQDKKGNSLLKLSKSNEGEARVVARHLRALLQTGLKQEEVAVITPYNKQVQTLKALLLESYPNLEIRSVDGFQGCEKEAVVMSLVRSNGSKQVGFLADDRRMNVAITRAKRHVAVVCDTETISAHKFLDVLVKHFETFGEYRSAQEYLDEDLVHGAADRPVVAAIAPAVQATKASASSTPVSKPRPAKSSSPSAATPSSKANAPSDQSVTGSGKVATPLSAAEIHLAEPNPEATITITTSLPAEEIAACKEEDNGVDSEEEKPEVIETKSASIFQMMSSDSDSSEDDEENEEQDELKSANSLLKDLHLSRLARQPPPAPATSKKKKGKKKKGTQRKAIPAAKSVPATVPVDSFKEEEGELEFLERQAKNSNKCSFQGAARCKKTISIMGSLCKFCKFKYCYEHGLPEVHGCGDAVRQFERVQFQQQARNPAEKKPLSADKRKLLKKKLEEKVTEKATGRTVKVKEKK